MFVDTCTEVGVFEGLRPIKAVERYPLQYPYLPYLLHEEVTTVYFCLCGSLSSKVKKPIVLLIIMFPSPFLFYQQLSLEV